MKGKACDGEQTLDVGDFQECIECGTRVRWDLVADPFFGFQTCAEKSQPTEPVPDPETDR